MGAFLSALSDGGGGGGDHPTEKVGLPAPMGARRIRSGTYGDSVSRGACDGLLGLIQSGPDTACEHPT